MCPGSQLAHFPVALKIESTNLRETLAGIGNQLIRDGSGRRIVQSDPRVMLSIFALDN